MPPCTTPSVPAETGSGTATAYRPQADRHALTLAVSFNSLRPVMAETGRVGMDSTDSSRFTTVSDGQALGHFLRARRKAVQPADVGLPTNRRRRVGGLRRDEVAVLAGISVEYYQRLEQGRDRH